MKELTSRQLQARATKKKIFETATKLLQTESFETLTMSRIASEAGVSVGTLYHHFKSKEELFFTNYNEFDQIIAELEDTVCFDSGIDAIRSAVFAQTSNSFYKETHFITAVLITQLSSHGAFFMNATRNFPRYILKNVNRAIHDGELRPIDPPEEIANTILRSSRGSIFDCAVRNTPQLIAQIAMHDLDLVLAHYHVQHRTDYPAPDPVWLNAYRERNPISSNA